MALRRDPRLRPPPVEAQRPPVAPYWEDDGEDLNFDYESDDPRPGLPDIMEIDDFYEDDEPMTEEEIEALIREFLDANPDLTPDEARRRVIDFIGGGGDGGAVPPVEAPKPADSSAGDGGDTGGGGRQIVGLDPFGKPIFSDGTVGGRPLPQDLIDRLPSDLPGVSDRQSPAGDEDPGAGDEDPGAGGGLGGGLTDPKFPGGAGGGGDNFPPVFPGGSLPPPTLPVIGGPTGTTDPNNLGGPGGDPNEFFGDLLDSFAEADTDANQASEDRYNDILQGYSDQLTGINNTLDETSEGLGNAEGILAGRWNRVGSVLEEGEGNLGQQFKETQGRLSESEAGLQQILAELGDQEREDVNRRWDVQAGNQEQGLIDRGLGNTTLRGNMLSGIEERRSDDLNRLRDSLARERVGQGNQAVNRQLGLDTLGMGQSENAIGRQSQYGLLGQQFGENTIGRQLTQDQNRLAYPMQSSQNMLDFQERRTDQGPDLSQLAGLAFQFGQFGSGDFGPRNLGNQYTTQPIPIQGQPPPQQNPGLPFISYQR